MKRLSNWLYSSSSVWTALAVLLVFLLFTAFVLPAQAQKAEAETGSSVSPDTSFIYTPRQLYEMADRYGEEGRKAYIQARFSFDLIFPLVYTAFLVVLISWLARAFIPAASPWRFINLVPILGMLFDFLENTSTSLVMARYPASSPLFASLAPGFTIIKWIFVLGSFLILFICALGWIINRARQKK